MDTKRTGTDAVTADRGEATRQKLLLAAIEVFGRRGYDGATTRALADAAGVNLQAIPYHFGGKEGLYHAVTDYIADGIAARLTGLRERLGARLAAECDGDPIRPDEAGALLTDLLFAVVDLLTSPELDSWARVISREQMDPTDAFEPIYRRGIGPQAQAARRLVGVILGRDPASEAVGVRTLSLLGSVLVFRVARAAMSRLIGWTAMGPREVEQVKAMLVAQVAALRMEGGGG